MILDTSSLVAAFDPDQLDHDACAEVLRRAHTLVLSPFVLAELDYFIRRDRSIEDELQLLAQVSSGALPLAEFSADDIGTARAVVDHYADLDVGLADASLVVLAHRYNTHDMFTLDLRHFRTMVALDGEPFRILPADVA
ncbi:MAG: PIN domain-containing protein [Acidimicrobiia bacterium]|nr:PIN domain-containing protein [Acidimicrobiia bacterium]